MPVQDPHGKRLPAEEYERRLVELYADLPPVPTPEQGRGIRRRELNLAIDRRLGTDFPADRRAALWEVQEKVERRRGWLLLRHLIRRLVPGSLERGSARLADFLISEYSKVLDPEELESFFGEELRGPPPSGRSDRSPHG